MRRGIVVTLSLAGTLDIATIAHLVNAGPRALQKPVANLTTDIVAVTFIDSTGISRLIKIRHEAQRIREEVDTHDPHPNDRTYESRPRRRRFTSATPASRRFASAAQ